MGQESRKDRIRRREDLALSRKGRQNKLHSGRSRTNLYKNLKIGRKKSVLFFSWEKSFYFCTLKYHTLTLSLPYPI